jgi:hypothetical protein
MMQAMRQNQEATAPGRDDHMSVRGCDISRMEADKQQLVGRKTEFFRFSCRPSTLACPPRFL